MLFVASTDCVFIANYFVLQMSSSSSNSSSQSGSMRGGTHPTAHVPLSSAASYRMISYAEQFEKNADHEEDKEAPKEKPHPKWYMPKAQPLQLMLYNSLQSKKVPFIPRKGKQGIDLTLPACFV